MPWVTRSTLPSPLGLWPWDRLSLRDPSGDDNDNGGCH
jgi:hypothetical protein